MAVFQKQSMRYFCLLVFAAVIGAINGQQLRPVVLLPDYRQYHCILSTSEVEALNIAEDCAGETILDVRK